MSLFEVRIRRFSRDWCAVTPAVTGEEKVRPACDDEIDSSSDSDEVSSSVSSAGRDPADRACREEGIGRVGPHSCRELCWREPLAPNQEIQNFFDGVRGRTT